MTTPRDLLIVTMDVAFTRPAEAGEVSLGLAGAELIDLRRAGTVELREDLIVPGGLAVPEDLLLRDAAAAVCSERPYESIRAWLWRRGNALADAYVAAFEREGVLVREPGHGFRPGRRTLADAPARRRAANRWACAEPVLLHLAQGLGAPDEPDSPPVADDAVAGVLAAVYDAVLELQAERQRRRIEGAAFDAVWRVLG